MSSQGRPWKATGRQLLGRAGLHLDWEAMGDHGTQENGARRGRQDPLGHSFFWASFSSTSTGCAKVWVTYDVGLLSGARSGWCVCVCVGWEGCQTLLFSRCLRFKIAMTHTAPACNSRDHIFIFVVIVVVLGVAEPTPPQTSTLNRGDQT